MVLWPFHFDSALASLKPRRPLKYSQLSYTDDAQVASIYPDPTPVSHSYFSCSGYLSTSLGNQTGTFFDGLVLFLPYNRQNHRTRAAVQAEHLDVVSAECPGSDRGYGHAGLCVCGTTASSRR